MDEIAEGLRTQREALGLRIEDIFERTRINPEFLEALEMGQYDILPKTYVRLFLRTYANELGLDADAIVARYETQHAPKKTEAAQPPAQRTQAPVSAIAIVVGSLFVIAFFAIRFSTSENQENAAPLDTAVAPAPTATPSAETNIPIVQETTQDEPPIEPQTAESTSAAVSNPPLEPTADANLPANEPPVDPESANVDAQNTRVSEPAAQASISQNTATDRPPEPEPVATPTPTVYDLPMLAQFTDDQPMVLSGIVRQTTRLQVAADGRNIFSGELRMGSQPRWQARDSFRVHMDRADAIDLSLQGQTLSPPQSPNHSIRLLVTRTQIRVEELPPSDAGDNR